MFFGYWVILWGIFFWMRTLNIRSLRFFVNRLWDAILIILPLKFFTVVMFARVVLLVIVGWSFIGWHLRLIWSEMRINTRVWGILLRRGAARVRLAVLWLSNPPFIVLFGSLSFNEYLFVLLRLFGLIELNFYRYFRLFRGRVFNVFPFVIWAFLDLTILRNFVLQIDWFNLLFNFFGFKLLLFHNLSDILVKLLKESLGFRQSRLLYTGELMIHRWRQFALNRFERVLELKIRGAVNEGLNCDDRLNRKVWSLDACHSG